MKQGATHLHVRRDASPVRKNVRVHATTTLHNGFYTELETVGETKGVSLNRSAKFVLSIPRSKFSLDIESIECRDRAAESVAYDRPTSSWPLFLEFPAAMW